MPIYEYECPKCTHIVEVMQDFDAPAPSVCDACGQNAAALAKVMSRTSFQLKGTGWYTTDYKRPPSNAAASPAASTSATPPPSAAVAPASAPITPPAAKSE